ncbi:MAG: bifunctional folylpolyglutamate synthase/dihydrofolate synthase, partial [Chloroflexia bacterium]|nr:bifunctional folylpolyglutamate synthase/dihydrofolate synthase [Chloroflexia bacterium]
MTQITTFDDAMAAIRERSGYDRGFISNPFAGDDAARLGLVRTARVLDLLGNPERDYPIVHVAGSKGKGSTA